MAVASTHQSGRSAARTRRAIVALRRSPNKAKQVAPDPDIPVATAPGIRANLSRTTAIAGAMRTAAASRSFRLEARKSRIAAGSRPSASNGLADDSRLEPGASPSAAKTFGVGAWTWGLTRTANIFGSGISWTKSIANAGHHSRMRIKADENVRSRRPCRSAHLRIVDRQSSLVGEQPQGRRGVRGASAKPRRGRQSFDQSEAAEFLPGACAASARAARNTRFSSTGPASSARGPTTSRTRSQPGSNPTQSHSPANATRLSSS